MVQQVRRCLTDVADNSLRLIIDRICQVLAAAILSFFSAWIDGLFCYDIYPDVVLAPHLLFLTPFLFFLLYLPV